MKLNSSPENIAQIAREAIQRVAAQRLQLTPENYANAFAQAAGTASTNIASPVATTEAPLEWGSLISRLLSAIDTHHSGITTAKKREAVQRVLSARISAQALHQRLEKLIQSWVLGVAPSDAELHLPVAAEASLRSASRSPPSAKVAALAGPVDPSPTVAALTELFALLLENLAELTPESGVLVGQISRIRQLFSEPVDERTLAEARRQIRAMIMKQGVIKHSLEDAKAVLKQMLSTLVDRLGVMSDATGGYHKKIESYMEEINSTENFTNLSHVVKGLLSDTRGMSTDILRAREELVDTRRRVRAQDSKIHELETELVRVSELVRTDPLTAALNRRGFEEAYAVELARAERSATKLCVALIDLDDFKRLNDANGHQAGDDALVHLVAVIKEMTRPTDAVGRYGGEEFVILFPDTELAGAAHVTTRIQRSLTKRFFLHNNERLFISFSAGVAEVDHNLGLAEALERADKAVYEAKAAGKNRVITT